MKKEVNKTNEDQIKAKFPITGRGEMGQA